MLPVSGIITKYHWEFDTQQREVPERMETDSLIIWKSHRKNSYLGFPEIFGAGDRDQAQ